jgi:putative ATP-binding cassette transporter
MSLIGFLLRRSRKAVLLSALVGAVGGVAGIALIALIQQTLATEPSARGRLALAFFALVAVAAVARAVAHIGMVTIGQEAVTGLGLRLVRDVLVLPVRAFETLDSSTLLSALTDDIAIVAGAMVGVPQLCINIPIVVACVAYTGWLAPRSVACGVVFAGLAIVAFLTVSSRGMKALARAREHQATLIDHFRTLIGGFRELKIHRGRRRAFLTESVEPTLAAARTEMVQGLGHFAAAEGWGQLAFFGFIGFLLFAAPAIETISPATLVSAVLIVLYLMTPLDAILTWLPAVGRAQVSLMRIQNLIPSLERQGGEGDHTLVEISPLEFRDSISLDGVSFMYYERADQPGFALGPIDLVLRRGELVVLAGGNGNGKTTLVKLLTGLYAPDSGQILVDGQPLVDGDREAFRQLFSIVFADGHVFRDFRGVGSDDVASLAHDGLDRLRLAPLVSIENNAFSTLDLSQGQRRRLALLGALLEDRPVCIFDEWAANQDAAFKQIFYHQLLPQLKASGKALLVISHDENHFDAADRVVRLQDGRLLEESPLGLGGAWA